MVVPLMRKNKSQFSTDKEIKEAKPTTKEYALSDRKTTGLQLRIKPNGKKQWIYRYSSPTIKVPIKTSTDNNSEVKYKGKRNNLGLGLYPIVTLSQVREEVHRLQKLIQNGIDPNEHKKEKQKELIKSNHSQIHIIFYEWIKTLPHQPSTIHRKVSLFENNLFPYLEMRKDKDGNISSSKNIQDIKHPEILKAVNEKKKSANEMARRLLGNCRTLWNYAIAHGYIETNIIDLIPTSEKPKKNRNHLPKISDEIILGQLLNDIDTYTGHPIVKCALQILPYLMLRAENLTKLKWEHVYFSKQIIIIPRKLMKVKDKNLDDFKLPLTNNAITILKEVQQFTQDTEWVFHGITKRSQSLNPATLNKALNSMGYNDENQGTKQTIHSFRGTFSSLAYQYRHKHQQYEVIIERVLDHQEKNEVVASYNHKADYTDSMRELLNWWETFLGEVKNA
jgi:integrase